MITVQRGQHAVLAAVLATMLAAMIAAGEPRVAPVAPRPSVRVAHRARMPSHRRHPWRRWVRLRGGQDMDAVVGETLAAEGLSRYAAAFEREGIQARNLPDLTADDLAELGLSPSEATNFLARLAAPGPEARCTQSELDPVVAARLSVLGLAHHRAAFEREGIAARNLADLSAQDLQELVGVCGVSPCQLARLNHCSEARIDWVTLALTPLRLGRGCQERNRHVSS